MEINYLALIGPIISCLHIFDDKSPLVSSFTVLYLEPIIVCVYGSP